MPSNRTSDSAPLLLKSGIYHRDFQIDDEEAQCCRHSFDALSHSLPLRIPLPTLCQSNVRLAFASFVAIMADQDSFTDLLARSIRWQSDAITLEIIKKHWVERDGL